MLYRCLIVYMCLIGLVIATAAEVPIHSQQSSVLEQRLQPTNLTQLLSLPVNQIEALDVGIIDLLCAEGLPGFGRFGSSKMH